MNTLNKAKKNNKTIWSGFVNGNQNDFASIYNEHIDVLYLYGFKICPNKDLIKDCIQDVFVDLFQHKEKLNEPSNVKLYLFKVLKHTVFRKLKKERKFGDLSERKHDIFEVEYCIEKVIINEEIEDSRKLLLCNTLKKLSSKQQEILYLRFTMGFDYHEISEIIKIDHNSVRKQVYRAIKKLRASEAFSNNISLLMFLYFQKN